MALDILPFGINSPVPVDVTAKRGAFTTSASPYRTSYRAIDGPRGRCSCAALSVAGEEHGITFRGEFAIPARKEMFVRRIAVEGVRDSGGSESLGQEL